MIAARENLDHVPESQYDALLGQEHTDQSDEELVADDKRKGLLAFLRTRDFWTVLVLGYVILYSTGMNLSDKTNRQALAILNTSSSTFTSLLEAQGTSIPAFQTFFNYALLNITFTSYTIYKYGFKRWGQITRSDGWKCMSPSLLHRPFI